MALGRKHFFFEKKKQKTFACFTLPRERAALPSLKLLAEHFCFFVGNGPLRDAV
jgi:hypothetical protein